MPILAASVLMANQFGPARPFQVFLSLGLMCPSMPRSSRPCTNLSDPALLCYGPSSLALLHCTALSFPPLSGLLTMPGSARSCQHLSGTDRPFMGLPVPVRSYLALPGPLWHYPADSVRPCPTLALSNTAHSRGCPVMLTMPSAVRSCPMPSPGRHRPTIRGPTRFFLTLSVLSGAIMLHPALHEPVRSCPTLPWPTQTGPTLSCLPYPIMPGPALPYTALPATVRFCWLCQVLSGLTQLCQSLSDPS